MYIRQKPFCKIRHGDTPRIHIHFKSSILPAMSAVASIVSMAIACAVMGAGASRIIIADTIIVRIYIMNSMPVIVTAAHTAIVTDAVPILIRIGTGCSRKIA